MSYYSPITEDQDNLFIYLYRIVSSISFIPYISFLIVCFLLRLNPHRSNRRIDFMSSLCYHILL